MTTRTKIQCVWLLLLGSLFVARADESLFARGHAAYASGDFVGAREAFRASASNHLASGTLLNLGNAEWQAGEVAAALLAWEQARWVKPWDRAAENNLKFGRNEAQVEAPDWTWYEFAASWLPANWWAWLAAGSLWSAVALALLPIVLRWRKSAWQQACVAAGLGIFLLTIPANVGAWTRTRMGFVLQAETKLRFTPTADAEAITALAEGEPARVVRTHGRYLLVETRRTQGWLDRKELGMVLSR